MTYLKQGWNTDDYHLIKAMDILAERVVWRWSTRENGGASTTWRTSISRVPMPRPGLQRLPRPAALEEEAVFRAIRLAEVVDCPLYIAHVTAARAVAPHIRRAQAAGQPRLRRDLPPVPDADAGDH